ncbi:hypothetical protein GUJ93_ZPchr0013g35950 [Zizania palustris]|uniref:Uncharacterized protein n=1 Tax=Zizania palustris TaxID=103762 RepID=A0A8J5WYD5_ZIZPA|nr:hypothetical protein GUJ93_ZPchr0013g35950 [Zizania palustris]
MWNRSVSAMLLWFVLFFFGGGGGGSCVFTRKFDGLNFLKLFEISYDVSVKSKYSLIPYSFCFLLESLALSDSARLRVQSSLIYCTDLSFSCAAMDPRQHSVYPGSSERGRRSGERGRRIGRGSGERGKRSGSGESGSSSGGRRRGSEGSGGDGSVDTSMTQRRHILAQSIGTRLMPEFNAAAGCDDGVLFGSSLGGFDLELEESPLRYFGHCVQPEASPRPNPGRLFFRTPVGSPTRDDEVIVMDGVLVDNVSVSGPKRSSSFSNVGFVPACSTGSGGRNRYDFNRQMEPQVGRAVQGAGFNMQTPLTPTPRGLPICPPSHPGAIALGGAMTVPIKPHGYPYFMPQRPAAATTGPPPGFLARNQQLPPQPPQQQRTASTWPPKAAAAIPAGPPSSSAPKQPKTKPPAETKEPEETKPPAASSFAAPREAYTWPLTEEEDAYITDLLYTYTPSGRRRLPVFRSICPD